MTHDDPIFDLINGITFVKCALSFNIRDTKWFYICLM